MRPATAPVRLPLPSGPLNGARWCLGALPGRVIDVSAALPTARGPESRAHRRCPGSCSSGPLGPPCPEAGQGHRSLRPPDHQPGQTLSEPFAGRGRSHGRGGRGTHALHRPRERVLVGRGAIVSSLGAGGGGIVCDEAAPSHLLLGKPWPGRQSGKRSPLGRLPRAPPPWRWSSCPRLPGP